jgi:4-amino-4-deoxy-L-arabinose transferase-like glycosyltransferase
MRLSSSAVLTRASHAQPALLRSAPQARHRLLGVEADDPAWTRPALIAIVLLAAGLMLVDVTRSGYGNTYYAAGALAASHSWTALFTNAADLSGFVSLDKGPLPDWMMGLSGRVFGFGSFSVMLPNALCGVTSVIVLYDAVRRALGHQIALGAALIMALTPVAVLVGRYNTPDALLLLLLVCAAWSLTVAMQSGRTRDLLLCGAFVGLAFNTKMLEAYIVLPALAVTFLVAGRGSVRRRLGQLAAWVGVVLLVSLSWFGSMMLLPASDRPFVGDSTGNSWFQLILDGNGLRRVGGNGNAFGSEVDGRLLRLFSHHVGGQIAWLLPLALIGIVIGLFTTWRSRRADPAFGAYLLWSTWGLACYAVFSFSVGIFHAYYTSLLAPPVATLSAAALVTLWRAARASHTAALALATVIGGISLLSFVLLAHAGGFLPWLRWVVFVCGCIAGAAVIAPHLHASFRGAATVALGMGAAAVALLAGPAAYSIATVDRAQTGYDPIAGPAVVEKRPVAADPHPGALSPSDSLALLIPYLSSHRDGARFLVAATDARTAAPIALATGLPVITVGGFGGANPTPTAAQLERVVRAGQLRYVLLDATREWSNPGHRVVMAPEWVKGHCSLIPYASILKASTAGSLRSRSAVTSKLSLFACGSAAPKP